MGLLNAKNMKRSTTQPKSSGASSNITNRETETCFRNALVLQRTGSQYFDKDGHLAHEFYEEVTLPDGHITMQRITTDLTPQGLVNHEHPRLHPDYPYVLV